MTNIALKIIGASVLLRSGTDQVSLEVDKPSPFPPGVSTQLLRMSFECQANKGADYCREHFGIEPRIINAR